LRLPNGQPVVLPIRILSLPRTVFRFAGFQTPHRQACGTRADDRPHSLGLGIEGRMTQETSHQTRREQMKEIARAAGLFATDLPMMEDEKGPRMNTDETLKKQLRDNAAQPFCPISAVFIRVHPWPFFLCLTSCSHACRETRASAWRSRRHWSPVRSGRRRADDTPAS
jgi:hypothetical protein